MFIKRNNKRYLKAQSILEYSVVTACIIAALVVMRVYMKRGVEGAIKESSDMLGEQYDAVRTSATITATMTSTQNISSELVHLTDGDGVLLYEHGRPLLGVRSTVNMNDTMSRSGTEELGEFSDDLFE